MNTKKDVKTYAATLLYQYSVKGEPSTIRLCEKQIIHVKASSDREALRLARKHGKSRTSRYENAAGSITCFDFVAVTDLIDLMEPDPGDPLEVWYDILRLKTPLERKQELEVVIDKQGYVRRQRRT